MAPLFKVRAPASGGSNKIDLTGYGSSNLNPSHSHDSTEKSFKMRKSRGLNVQYLPALIVGLVLFSGYSMHSAKYRSGHVIKDVSNNHAFGMKLSHHDRQQLQKEETRLGEKVAALEKMVWYYQPTEGMFMENDPNALKMIRELQHFTQKLVLMRYGNHKTFRVALDLEFPSTIPDYQENGDNTGRVVFEMGPIDLIPCSVFYFLEIARTFKKGSFIRNAPHVLQASVISKVRKEMPFQEYSPEHPHKKGTTGYAGRPSGPQFYISIEDNTKAHGPGSQQKENPYEADANFGHVVEGMEDVVPRIHSVPQKGFLDKPNLIKITSMTILYDDDETTTADGSVEWKEWKESASTSSFVTSS
mmetsp:Transcript_40247/g.97163  ORF Transcript_40247/g.97163 Transcript_40247/m.97163 type:complete len:359 (-) Transcript_40247:256-1332(-)